MDVVCCLNVCHASFITVRWRIKEVSPVMVLLRQAVRRHYAVTQKGPHMLHTLTFHPKQGYQTLELLVNLDYCERRYFGAVHIFALFAFIKYPRKYVMEITFIMPHRGNNIKNANINLREIANFRNCMKIHTRKDIYIHRISKIYF